MHRPDIGRLKLAAIAVGAVATGVAASIAAAAMRPDPDIAALLASLDAPTARCTTTTEQSQ
jgi:hypothetical protein